LSQVMNFLVNITSTKAIHHLSLHDALTISRPGLGEDVQVPGTRFAVGGPYHQRCEVGPVLFDAFEGDDAEHLAHPRFARHVRPRSEELTSELQSRFDLVCRLMLEKKKKK